MADAKKDSKWLRRAADTAAMVPYWDKVDAIVEGYEAVKLAGETYLPKFCDETKSEYAVRLELTKFTNIYRDVLEGLATKPFEEEVTILGDAVPSQITEFAEDVDGSGSSLTMFSAVTFFNGINSAIDWIFIDYPTVAPGAVRTVADVKASGARPFWSHVLGRNVLEVRTINVNGSEVLEYMRIYEPGLGEPDHVRVFVRQPTGIIIWFLMVESTVEGNDEGFIKEADGILTIDVIPLVPFITGRRDGHSFKFFPVMRDAADLQITLYRNESGLEFTKTMAAYPMLAANGVKPDRNPDNSIKNIAVGPNRVLYAPADSAGNAGSWAYVEPQSTSLTFLKSDIDGTKQDLRELGRQPLTAQSGQLTVITTAVAAGKARSAVSAWALALKNSLENAMVVTAKWLAIEYEPELNVFTEFDDVTDAGKDLVQLQAMRVARDLSQETLWQEMKRRKVLSPEFDAEEEKKKLLDEVPSDGTDLENANDVPQNDPTQKPESLKPLIKPAAKA